MRVQSVVLTGLIAAMGMLSCTSGEPTANTGPSLTSSTVSASTGSITADGASTATITVQLRNGSGTAITSSGGTVTMTATAGTLSGVTDHQNGSYTATLTAPTTAGAAIVVAQLNGQALTSSATVAFVAAAVDLTHSTIATVDSVVTADGVASTVVTVRARDAHDNAVTASLGVTIASTKGSVSSVAAAGGGVYTATLTSPTTAATGTVSAQVNSQPLVATASVRFAPGAVSLSHSTVTVADSVLTADGASVTTVTVRALDSNNNPIGGSVGPVTVAATSGTLGTVTNAGNGVYTATLTSSVAAGVSTVSAKINAQSLSGTASVRYAPGPVSLSHSTLSVADTVLVASGSSTTLVTVQARDAHDNPITTALTLTVLTTAGSVGTVNPGGGGAYTATLTSSTALVTATVSAKINAQAVTTTAGVRFKIGPPAAIVVSAGNSQIASVLATLPGTITVTVSDGFGHATAGSTVVFSIAAGAGSVTSASIVTDASGHASVGSWTMGAASGANTLTATAHVTDASSAIAAATNVSATAHLYHYAQSYDANHAVATMAWSFGPHVQVFLNDESNVFFQAVTYSVASNDAGCTWTATTITCPLGTLTSNVVFNPAAVAHVANPSFQATLALPVDAPPRIVFMSDSSGSNEIYAMFPDGSGITRLTNDANDDLAPVWSPDRRKITWYSTRSGQTNVYVMNANGSSQTPETTGSNTNAHPDWSPSGTQIAYQCSDGTHYQLCIVNADGTSPTPITGTGYHHFDPEWSPSGTLLLHDNFKNGTQQLAVISTTGTGESVLTSSGVNRTGRWSPDGTKIVFTSTRDGNDEIYVMNADGSSQTRITNDAGDDDVASWSPDGTKIIFGSNRTGTFQLYTMNADGSNVVRLTNDTGNDRHPNWH